MAIEQEEEQIITVPLMKPMSTFPVTVLLIDDQQIIAESVKAMLADQKDIVFHYCQDPLKAIETAASVHPTVILQDLVMPEINGLDLTRYFKANDETRNIPLIVLSSKEDPAVKAEAFSLGANDYIVKLPDKLELVARIRYHSNGYIRLLERNEAYEKLRESQQILNAELAEAAEYVRSLLPARLKEDIVTDWQFTPSTQLGGDAFGYHWLDKTHFVIYLLDVCGHGVGAALLSISVMNVIRSQSLSNTNFTDPARVMKALNEAFPMEKQNNMFFTMWYGVWNSATGELVYTSAGHPPAILIDANKEKHILSGSGIVVGALSDVEYENSTATIKPGSQLFVFSDGTYEVVKQDKTMMKLEDFIGVVLEQSKNPQKAISNIFKSILRETGDKPFADDYSILQVIFN